MHVVEGTGRNARRRCGHQYVPGEDDETDHLFYVDRRCVFNSNHHPGDGHWIGAHDPTTETDTFIRWETP
jgi:hypothetical protein